MKWLGQKKVALKKIQVTGEFSRKRKSPVTARIVSSLPETGGRFIHVPVVEAGTFKIVAGEHRIAAAFEAKQKSVLVELVEGSERELSRIRAIENLMRNHSGGDEYAAELRAFVDDIEADVKAERAAQLRTGESEITERVGRPKTDRGIARERAAAVIGASPDEVKRVDLRGAAKDSPPTSPAGQPTPTPSREPVETWGLSGPEALLPEEIEQIVPVQEAVDKADKLLRQVQSAIAPLEHGSPLAQHVYAAIYREIHTVAAEVRRHRPHAICPYCKRVPAVRAVCQACHTLGIVPACETENITPELVRRELHVVAANRGLVPIEVARKMKAVADAEWIPEPPAAKAPKKPAKTLTILMADGQVFDPGDGPEVPEEYQPDALPSAVDEADELF